MTSFAHQTIMWVLAVATPVVGAGILLTGRSSAAISGEPVPTRLRRAAILLILAGPVNLAIWLAMHERIGGVDHRNWIGMGAAAAVFAGMACWRYRGRNMREGKGSKSKAADPVSAPPALD